MRVEARVVALAVLVVVGLCGCVALTGSTLGQNIDDTNITTEIKARLAAEKAATLTRVHVETQQGTVYLTGIVATEALKERAGERRRKDPRGARRREQRKDSALTHDRGRGPG